VDQLEEDLQRIDDGLRLLQAEYNRFFIGAADIPPNQLHGEVRALVQRLSQSTSTLRPGERFRVNGVISRFQVLSQFWSRTVRQFEEGQPTLVGARGRARSKPVAAPPAELELGRAHVVLDRAVDESELRELHARYVNATDSPDRPPPVSFERFRDQVVARLERLRQRGDADSALLRVVVVDNRAILKIKSGA
jgi:hypothetical protein